MIKGLAAVFILLILTAALWAGWLIFEKNSVLLQTEYSGKTVRPLNPNLRIEAIENP